MRNAADKAARTEAEVVVQRLNDQLARGPTCCSRRRFHVALLAGTPLLDVLPGLRDQQADGRSPPVCFGRLVLVLGLRYSWCPESAPMPKLIGLFALPPVRRTQTK
jgi:hypothetical protein